MGAAPNLAAGQLATSIDLTRRLVESTHSASQLPDQLL